MDILRKNTYFLVSRLLNYKKDVFYENIHYLTKKSYSNKPVTNKIVDRESGKVVLKKTKIIPKITLLSGANKMDIITLEEAQKIAKKKAMKLIKVSDNTDNPDSRPIYKMLSENEYFHKDLNTRDKKTKKDDSKGEKFIIIGHNVSEHDLQVRVKKIVKLVEKKHTVRLIINGDSTNMQKAEKVYNYLEQNLSEHCRVLQKVQKESNIKCHVIPLKEPKSTKNSSNENNTNNDSSGENL